MREHTTDEIEKSLLECAEGRSCNGCIEISKSCEMGCIDCIISLKRVAANRLKAQQKEIDELKKKLAETYTAEQFIQDARRMIDKDYPAWLVRHMTDNPQDESNYVREWAASHPEKPKVTNGDKFQEVFGIEIPTICLKPETTDCVHSGDGVMCVACEYGVNGEYKAPSDK